MLYTRNKATITLFYKKYTLSCLLRKVAKLIGEERKTGLLGFTLNIQFDIHILCALLLCASFTEDWYRVVFSTRRLLPNWLLPWLIADFDWPRGHNIFFRTPTYVFFRYPTYAFRPMQFTGNFRCSLFTIRHNCASFFWNPHQLVCQRLKCNTG